MCVCHFRVAENSLYPFFPFVCHCAAAKGKVALKSGFGLIVLVFVIFYTLRSFCAMLANALLDLNLLREGNNKK